MPTRPKAHDHAQRQAAKQHRDKARGSFRQRGYSTAWSKLSAAWRLANPWCEDCKALGIVQLAHLVDHVKPMSHFPELLLDKDNLRSLCRKHHTMKTNRDAKLYAAAPRGRVGYFGSLGA